MKCPFRKILKCEYADFGKGQVVLDTQKEDFLECYVDQCPCWRYEYDRGYYCAQIDSMTNKGEQD